MLFYPFLSGKLRLAHGFMYFDLQRLKQRIIRIKQLKIYYLLFLWYLLPNIYLPRSHCSLCFYSKEVTRHCASITSPRLNLGWKLSSLAYKIYCITSLSILAAITNVIVSLRIGRGVISIQRLLAFSKFLLPSPITSQLRGLRTTTTSLRHHNILAT